MKINPYLSTFLDLMRGLAAFFVLIGHIILLLFLSDYRNITYMGGMEYNFFENILLISASYGFQSVLIFFVLSGYLVSQSAIRIVNNDNDKTLKDYFIDRIFRIHTVLIPALILTFFLDKITITINSVDSIMHRLNLENFIGNIFLLQEILVDRFGSNGPLWSLSYEFWYYMFFPLGYLIYINRFKVNYLVIIFFLLIFTLLPIGIKKYFIIWLIGASINFIKKPIFNSFYIPFSVFAIMFILSSSYFNLPIIGFIYYSIMALFLALTINSLLFVNIQPNYQIKKISSFFANFSYSLYLVHYPFLILLSVSLPKIFGVNILSFKEFYIFLIILFSAYLISYIFYYFTERNTKYFKHKFYNLIKRSK